MAAPSMVGEPASAEQTGAQTLPILRDLWFEVKKLGIHCLRAGIRGHPVLLLHGGGNREHVLTEEILDEIIALARRAGSGAAFRQLQRSEYQWRGLRTNYLHRLSEIKVPTLLVHGAEDRVVPVSWAERAHSLIKNSKIEIIRRCGHLPPVEQPEQFNRIIRGFLLGQCASPDSRARFSWPSLGPGVHQVFQQCSQLAVNPGNPRKLDLHSGSVSGSASGRAGKISEATP